MSEWPIAYSGVPLWRHLCCVAEALHRLMAERLLARTPAVAWFEDHTWRGSVLDAGLLAAVLHDAGKASRYYMGLGSFYLHEAVSAMLAYRLYMHLAGSRAGPVAMLAAMAVARHHAAMRGRLPRELHRDERAVAAAEIARALDLLNERDLEAARLRRLLGEHAFTMILKEPEEPDQLGHKDAYNRAHAVKERLMQLGEPRWLARILHDRRRSGFAGALVFIVTGALIVADVLVAGAEGRKEGANQGKSGGPVDESGAPAYARYWAEELGAGDLRSVLGCWEDCSSVEELLAGLRERISGL